MYKSSIIVVLTTVTVWLCNAFPNAATSPQTGVEMKLPQATSLYVSREREVSEEEKYWLPSDTEMLKRIYAPKGASSKEEAYQKSLAVTLLLSGADQRSLHRPEVCLDGQGWAIVDQAVVDLVVAGKSLKVKDLYLERTQVLKDGKVRKYLAHYVYWWVGSKVSTPETTQRAWISARENIFFNRNTRWGYPSIMIFVDTQREETRGQAQRRAYDFIEQHASVFLKAY